MNNKIILLVKWAIGLSILFTLIYKLDINQILATLMNAKPIIILLAFAYVFVAYFINAYNYKIILDAMNVRLKFSKIAWNYMISWSLGRFTPGRLGEFGIIRLLEQEKIKKGKGASLIVIDKFISLITLISVSSIGFFIFFEFNTAIKLIIVCLIILIILLLSLRLSYVRDFIKKAILKEKAKDFEGFYKNIVYVIKAKKMALFADFIVTLIRLGLGGIVIYILFMYFNIIIPIPTIIAITSIGVLLALIPVSIAGLGVTEASVIYLYSLIGVDIVIAGTIYLLIRAMGFLWAIIILSISSKRLLRL